MQQEIEPRLPRATLPFVIHNSDCTEWNTIWSNTIRVISKSDAERAARVRFQITSMFPTKISRHEYQLLLYYSHFEITEFSQYQYFIDLVTSLLKNGDKKDSARTCPI